jgi:4'-phosphopantetheinyl transferase
MRPAGSIGVREAPLIELRRFDLDVEPGRLSALHELLSPEERTRAARLRFARDAGRFVAGRGLVRRALASIVGCEPAELRIDAAAGGKPYLPDHPELHFNASGSGGIGLLATAEGLELGVDLELADPGFDGLEVARHFFTDREIAALEALEHSERPAAFLRCWTRKEAYLKALGVGLRVGLDSFEVSLLPGEPAELRCCVEAGELGRWTVADCSELLGGITAAVCHETHHGARIVMVAPERWGSYRDGDEAQNSDGDGGDRRRRGGM